MSQILSGRIAEICADFGNDCSRLMDIVNRVQASCGCVTGEAMTLIAAATGTTRVAVEGLVSFYAFLSSRPQQIPIRLCRDIIDRLQGVDAVAAAFEDRFGIAMGETTEDGRFSLAWTPCIGMCDQAPAALIGDTVVTELSPDLARRVADGLLEGQEPASLTWRLGDGNNADELIQSMVHNHIRRAGQVVLAPLAPGVALHRAMALRPAEVIRLLKTSRLRGRGGAGFPTGMKWDFTASTQGPRRFLICNADEGEPGTFKDRVILTEFADSVLEGMAIGGYAIGAREGIIYLRAEYAYLRRFLEAKIESRRQAGLLGKNICDRPGFDFDVRIQLGAGAYICGEETALISSCEGLRGDPKNRPPFPAQKGYLGCPTTVNNVETLVCVARILQHGAAWFTQLGSAQSSGTKVLSISGDCRRPGVFEVPFGTALGTVLEMAGAVDVGVVQVGGPSGNMLGPDEQARRICFDDLATGGSVMIFNRQRDPLEIVAAFTEFFCDESCGYCTPCRVGTRLLLQQLARLRSGHGLPVDLERLADLALTIRQASRCGLGQTAANPVRSSLANFRGCYERLISTEDSRRQPSFDLAAAVSDAAAITGRKPVGV